MTRVRRALRWRTPRLPAALAVLGPGLIAASAGNDAGGIATYATAGSQYAYRTLFVMVLVTVILVAVQELSARLGAVTGSGLMALVRERFPLRATAVCLACVVVANLGLVISEFAGIGAAMELLGVSRLLAVPVAAVAVWSTVVLGSYRRAEQVFLVLTLVFLTYPLAAVLGHPSLGAVVGDAVVPHLLADHQFLFLVMDLIGTTITPYMQLYQAAAVVEREATEADLGSVRADAVAGSVTANVVSMCIIVATAAALAGHGPLASADDAARALAPVVGSAATILFAVGLLAASALAAAVVPLSTSYAVAEAVGAERSVSRRPREAKLFVGLFTAQVVVGAAVALLPGNLFTLLVDTQVVNGLVCPILLGFLLVLAADRRLMGRHAAKGPALVVTTVGVAAVGVLATVVAVQTVLG